ncbi:hypothetical protein AYO44_15940 [Planctomycetaceae bacterium SCGC AG-212-F19]|nr:hypothetical protein AYO44_15940 [Planctomycetaceae bacterium SCGC AG-212-F19]
MGRNARPWYRSDRKKWFVTVGGEQHDLGPDEEKAQRKFHLLMAGRGEEQGDVKFRDAIDGYLAHLERHAKPNTYRVARYFLEHLPNVLTVKLTPGMVERWVKPDWSQATERSFKGTILSALNWAVTAKLLPANPLKGLTLPPMPSRGENAVLQPDDWKRLLQAVTDDCFRDFLMALKLTGARPGEVARVTADDFNADAGCWTLAEHKTDATGRKRVILLTADMVLLSKRLALRHPSGSLFRNTKDVSWKVNGIVKRMITLQRQLGIRCIAYGLRHTFATELLAAGVPDSDVAALMGHAGTGMLHKHFSHLLADTKRLRKTLCAAFG